MSHILLLTNSTGSSVDILPALELLNHRVHILPAEPTALLETERGLADHPALGQEVAALNTDDRADWLEKA